MSIQVIQRRLGRVRFRLRGLYFLHGVFRLLFLVGVYLLVDFGLDAALHLPLGVRIGFQVVALGGVAYLAYRHLVFPVVFQITEDDIAKHVERENPFLQGRLIATLQLSRLVKDPGYADSVAMTEALFRETDGLLARVDFSKMLRPGKVARAGALPIGVGAALTVIAVLFPLHAKIWFARNVLFQSVSWPRASTVGLIVRTYPVGSGVGTPIVVRTASGDEGEDLDLRLRFQALEEPGGGWTEIAMTAGPDGHRATLPPTERDLVFYVQILPGDQSDFLYVPDPDRRSPFYVATPRRGEDRNPDVLPVASIDITLPDDSIETAAGIYPVRAYVEGDIPRQVVLTGLSTTGRPIEVELSAKTIDRRSETGEVTSTPTRLFERGLELAEGCRFHLTGGDDVDDHPTYSVEVLIPPKLDQAIVWMEYPEYMKRQDKAWQTLEAIEAELAGLQARDDLDAADRARRESLVVQRKNALTEVQRAERKTYLGAIVHVRTRASQPLSEAWLVFDRAPLPPDQRRVLLEPAGADRRDLIARIDLDQDFDDAVVPPADRGEGEGEAPEPPPWQARHRSQGPDVRRVEFHFEVIGETGLGNRRHTTYTLHVVRDQSPEFTDIAPFRPNETRIERVPVALVDFKAKVSDDYGLTSVRIYYWTSPEKRDQLADPPFIELFALDEGSGEAAPTELDLEHTFDLELLEKIEETRLGTRRRGLEEGDVFEFAVVATDNRKVERLDLEPQSGAIGFFKIAIISKGRILEQTDKDLSSLKNLILEMKHREERIREESTKIGAQLVDGVEATAFRKEILDLRSEQTDRITRVAEGVAVSLRIVNDRFVVNGIESERPVHLLEMLPLIDAVSGQLSPAVAEALDTMSEGEQVEARQLAAEAAITGQTAVIDNFDALLALLTKWENYYEVVQEARRLRDLQEKINQKTNERLQD